MIKEASYLIEYYNRFCERSTRSDNNKDAIGLLTTFKYMMDYCPEHARVLDLYTDDKLYSAPDGHRFSVSTDGYGDKSIVLIRKTIRNDLPFEEITMCGSEELSAYPNCEFDVVLNLYAFDKYADAQRRELFAQECLRVLKPGGTLFIAYQNSYDSFFRYNQQWQSGFNIFDGEADDTATPLIGTTPRKLEGFMKKMGAEKLKNVATDGLRFITKGDESSLTEDDLDRYIKLHFEMCETDSLFCYSEHALYIGRKIAS